LRDILDQIVKWWDADEEFGLATVVRTFSSAPREPGAAMAVSSGAEVVGSVSGGCVEGAVYELACQVIATGQPVLERYGVSDDTAFSVGLTCGGIIDIFVLPVSKEHYPEFGEISAAVRANEPVAVATVIEGPGKLGARRVIWPADRESQAAGTLGAGDRLDQAVDDDARGMLAQGLTRRAALRRRRRAADGRPLRVRSVVRAAAADDGLRGDRLRGRRGKDRQVPRVPGYRM
jgi:xanthine dehydrogenase accessory factor